MKNTLTTTAKLDLSLTALDLCGALLENMLNDAAYGEKRSRGTVLAYGRLEGLCKALDAVSYHSIAASVINSTLKAYNGVGDTTMQKGLLMLIDQTADTLRKEF